jgi:hypothetical protein
MPRRKSKTGTCRLCGQERKLSFEHVPPQSAFNDAPVIEYVLEEMLKAGRAKGRIRQGGVGQHTLCESCNSGTGSWYGGEYVTWAEMAYEALGLVSSMPNPVDVLTIRMRAVHPLRFLKQVLTCFFSVVGQTESAAIASQNPTLVAFVLDKYENHLPSDIRVSMRLHDSGTIRSFPIGGELAIVRDAHGVLHASRANVFSEFTHAPFAFGLVHEGSYPHSTDISHFAEFAFDDNTDITLQLPIGRGSRPYPGS